MNNPSAELWRQALEKLSPEVGEEDLDLWLRPSQAGRLEDGSFELLVPNRYFSAKIAEQFQPRIETVLRDLVGAPVRLRFTVAPAAPAPRPAAEPAAPAPLPEPSASGLNPRYTFSSFVVGPANRFAHATAEAVSKNPGQRYNPFFLYGGVGLGKTHLLHAIGHGILEQNPRARVLYATAEQFVNEYIDSLRYDKPDSFRSKFRNADCLLIDDVQFLIAKGRSEEEFFHTYNSLMGSGKHVVLSSDRSPNELPMDQRVVSRFVAGVTADIKPPDYETRLAILRRKAEEDGLQVPNDVMDFIAKGIKSNIRQLEGSLERVAAYSQVLRTVLSIDLAKEILKDSLAQDEDASPVRVETILRVVAQKYSLEEKDLKGKKKTDNIAFPRHLAIYLACSLTNLSTTEIGDAFGGRDHTTVIYARDKIGKMIHVDPFFNETVNKLIAMVKSVEEH